MNYRKILLHYIYRDRASVYRAELVKTGKMDDFARKNQPIYENIPCHLSQYGKELSAHRDDTSQKITEDLRLTYDPIFDIRENDVIEVEHCGQIFRLFAGTPFKYATHTELSVRRRKEAGQT